MEQFTKIQDMLAMLQVTSGTDGGHPLTLSSVGCGVIRVGHPQKLTADADYRGRRNVREKHIKKKLYRIKLRGADLNNNPRRKGFLDLPAELRLEIYGYLLVSDHLCPCAAVKPLHMQADPTEKSHRPS